MKAVSLVKLEKIYLQNHPTLNEKWVQEIIAKDPSVLHLGEIVLKDKERIQHKAGRLDLLLQNIESTRRYEVEIQLGKVDESHIIRTIEYWDIEKKRYPQYDHCAVIIAEEITSRFLNVISIFNGAIPLIAIQMNAYKVRENEVALEFTTVLDELNLGLVEDDEETSEVADRSYWEARGTPQTVALADEVLKLIKGFEPNLELKYNLFYIGLANNGKPDNFVVFRAKKSCLNMDIKLKASAEIDRKLEKAGLELMDYDKRYGSYRIRLTKEGLQKNRAFIKELLELSYGKIAGSED